MAFKVRFGGIDLLSDGEGTFSVPQWSIKGRPRKLEPLGRGDGVLSKRMAYQGAQFVVEMRFKGLNEAGVTGLKTRLQNACNLESGTLEVRGFPDEPRCVISMDPDIRPGGYSAKVNSTSPGISVTVVLQFTKLY